MWKNINSQHSHLRRLSQRKAICKLIPGQKKVTNSQVPLIHLDRWTHGQRYIDQNFIYDIIIMFSKVNKYGGLTGAPWTFHMSTTYLYTNWVQWNKNHRLTLPDPTKSPISNRCQQPKCRSSARKINLNKIYIATPDYNYKCLCVPGSLLPQVSPYDFFCSA